MAQEQPTVGDIFRHALVLRRSNPQLPYKDLKAQLLKDFQGAQFPPVYNLAIPEQDARAPEEDWSAGLPLMLRGIQQQDWKEIINGVILSLEQTENYERERGGSDQTRDDWHDRTIGIEGQTEKGVGKWMPPDLMSLVERRSKK